MKKFNFIITLILLLTPNNSYGQNLKYKFTKESHPEYGKIPKIRYEMTEEFKAKIPHQPKNASGISDSIFNYNFKEKAKKIKSDKNYTYLLKLESPGSEHIGIEVNFFLPEGSQIKLTSSSGFERIIYPKPELKRNVMMSNGGSSDMLIMIIVPISNDEQLVFDLLSPVYFYYRYKYL